MGESVSVIIPTGAHHAQYVGDAVASCRAAVPAPDAVIVVDDEASPPVGDVGADHLIRQPHRGRSIARNVGASYASTRWLYFLDADDLLEGTAIADFHELHDRSPGDLYFADYWYSYGAEKREPRHRWRFPPWDYSRRQLRAKMVGNIGVFVRRERFLQIGGFEPSLDAGEDYDFWLRYALNPAIRVVKSDRPFFHARKRINSVTSAGSKWNVAIAEIRAKVAAGEYDRWVEE